MDFHAENLSAMLRTTLVCESTLLTISFWNLNKHKSVISEKYLVTKLRYTVSINAYWS